MPSFCLNKKEEELLVKSGSSLFSKLNGHFLEITKVESEQFSSELSEIKASGEYNEYEDQFDSLLEKMKSFHPKW